MILLSSYKSAEKQRVIPMAESFFKKLGDLAQARSLTVCLETTPAIYGCNFLTTTIEAATFNKHLNHPHIKLQFDTGTVITNQEDFEKEFSSYKNFISHIC